MLTREALSTGAYLESFRNLPGHTCWTEQRIESSLREVLARRPQPDEPVWLFTYGSLMWNPLFHFEERRHALLHGWHRSFCIRLIAGRGCGEHPGRMLALEAGGSTSGVAFKLREAELEQELRLVWIREMVGGVYLPTWGSITLEDKTTVDAISFMIDPTHALYEGDASTAAVSAAIAKANGPLGSNRDYLFQLDAALAAHGLRDAYIEDLARSVRGLASPGLKDSIRE
ncbi:MAG: gamma-glutamylcyclotransferase [Pigmentiphaga sp.]|nr:gamma-glutamylcyclotransferase [Pigmentiphaga sp.]